MIRILLALAVAAAAYFGPWAVNSGAFVGADMGGLISGQYFAGTTVECFLAKTVSVTGECAPVGELMGKAITAAVLASVLAAVAGIFGLLPVIGRFTSVIALIAGVLAVAAAGLMGFTLVTGEAGSLGDLRWGTYATGGFGLLSMFAAIAGMRGVNA